MQRAVGRRQLLVGGGAFVVTLLAGCISVEPIDGEGNGGADVEEVQVAPGGEFRFEPEELAIDPEQTVRFTWQAGGFNLSVIQQPDDADWEGVPEAQEAGSTHEHTFTVGGVYRFESNTHEGDPMEGTITVEEDVDPGGDPFD
ncbi:MAG: plastocyanin/azurin family copper-binding protein [Halobacteriota archaeon]